jgi:hypothetical protein
MRRSFTALILLAACRPTAEPRPAVPSPPTATNVAPVVPPQMDLPRFTMPVNMPLGADDPVVACVADSDCTLLEIGCCDHCNGGAMLSVARDHVDTARARWGAKECATATCNEAPCSPTRAWCDAGTCIRTEREVWQTSSGPREYTLLIPNVAP